MGTKRTTLFLLNELIVGNLHPTEEEYKTLLDIKKDISDFVEHWDEGVEKTKSPFYYINSLNKMAKENKVLENVDLANLSNLLKKIHGQRYGFDACILDKDDQGRFVTLCNTINGKVFKPIEPSLSAYLDAFIDKIFEFHKFLNTYE